MIDWWDQRIVANSQLRGCFIADESYPALDNHIFLLYEFSGQKWWLQMEELLKSSEFFEVSYEPNKNTVMFVYKVPEDYQESYNMFKQSKFSKLKKNLKEQIVKFHGEKDTRKAIAVIEKHESMFLEWEEKINKGLDSNHRNYVRISREQEAAFALNDDEIYSSERFKPSLPALLKAKEDNTFEKEGKIEDDGN